MNKVVMAAALLLAGFASSANGQGCDWKKVDIVVNYDGTPDTVDTDLSFHRPINTYGTAPVDVTFYLMAEKADGWDNVWQAVSSDSHPNLVSQQTVYPDLDCTMPSPGAGNFWTGNFRVIGVVCEDGDPLEILEQPQYDWGLPEIDPISTIAWKESAVYLFGSSFTVQWGWTTNGEGDDVASGLDIDLEQHVNGSWQVIEEEPLRPSDELTAGFKTVTYSSAHNSELPGLDFRYRYSWKDSNNNWYWSTYSYFSL